MLSEEIKKRIQEIGEDCKDIRPSVAVVALVYNHSQYLKDFFTGILSQETNFNFVLIVHDDASNDGSKEIITEYERKYPQIVKPILESNNIYSKNDGSLLQLLKDVVYITKAKYIAYCEGDDYWIDKMKLQKQFSFMEKNPDYSLCATNACNLVNNKVEAAKSNVTFTKDISFKNVVMLGGAYLSSPSLFFKAADFLLMPEAINKLYVLDYPLQIFLANRGRVAKLATSTCIHRVASQGSWTEKNRENRMSSKFVKTHISNEKYLIDTLNEITDYKHNNIFKRRDIIFRFHSLLFIDPAESRKILNNHFFVIIKYAKIKTILYCLLPKSIKIFLLKFL